MNTMNATSIYVSTCRYVIQADPYDSESWGDLYRYLPYLRQALTCYVCANILHIPVGPSDSICQHHVCRRCVGGKMRLKPSCSWCKDHSKFRENSQLRIMVQCFKKLCEYIASSAIAISLSNTNNGGTNALMTILQEGMAISDTYTFPVGAPLSLLPPTLQKVRESTAGKERGRGGKAAADRAVSAAADGRATEPEPDASHSMERVHAAAAAGPGYSLSDNGHCASTDGALPQAMASTSVPRSPRSRSPKGGTTPETQSPSPRKRRKSQREISTASSEAGIHTLPEQHLCVTVAAEHDYNKGLPSDEETSHKIKEQKLEREKQVTRVKPNSPKERQRRSSGRGQKQKGSGCRCGLATANPGKLTCCGQRCPCYSAFKGCTDGCRCRGCRNPRGDPNHATLLAAGLIPVSIRVTQIKQEDSDDTDVDIDV